MSGNYFCHICGGLVDLIRLQPSGVRFCECEKRFAQLRAENAALKAELAEAKKDADRWQGLMTILQTAYSGSVQEFGEGYESLIIDCAMVSGYKTERRVQAVLSWRDVRDEPLDLATSLDKAIEAMKGK